MLGTTAIGAALELVTQMGTSFLTAPAFPGIGIWIAIAALAAMVGLPINMVAYSRLGLFTVRNIGR